MGRPATAQMGEGQSAGTQTADHGRYGRRRLTAGWLLLASLALLLVAWVAGNPPGMSADEPAHYRKAVALAHGDLRGRPGGYLEVPANTASQLAWLNRTSRAMTVPPGLRGCDAFRLPLRGTCPDDWVTRFSRPVPPGHEVTYVATYPPYAYVVPAVATRVVEAGGGGTTAALLGGRLAVAALCLALLALAGRLLLRGGGIVALAGLALATSPMVVFLMAELGGSGPEVAGAIAFTVGLLYITRPPADEDTSASRWAWIALAAGGLVLTTSRSLGPGWVLALLVLVAVLRGPKAMLAAARHRRRAALATAMLIGAGTAAMVSWNLAVEPHPELRLGTVLRGLGPGIGKLPDVLAQAVGVFGWVDVELPVVAQMAWGLLVAGLVTLAILVGDRRQRWALAVAVLAALAAPVVVSAAVIRPTSADFRMQGRYVLPVLVALPLLAAEVLVSRHDRLRRRVGDKHEHLLAGGVVTAVVLQALGWTVNAVHYATDNTFAREYATGWAPPGGWLPWVAAVIAAVGLVCWAALRLQGSATSPGSPAAGPAAGEGSLSRNPS